MLLYISEKQTRAQRSKARRLAEVAKLEKIAKDPSTSWILGKFANFEARRIRPLASIDRLDTRSAEWDARSEAKNQARREMLIATIGKQQRIQHGEPGIIPESEEVSRFAAEQQAAPQAQTQLSEEQPPHSPEES